VKRLTRWRTPLQHLAVAATAFLGAYLLVAFAIIPEDIAASDVTVPGVVGMTQGDAQRRLQGLGLKVSLGETRFSADAPKSTVLAQNPVGGTAVAPGSAITLDISAGQQRSTIPALAGLSRDAAEAALGSAGLGVGQIVEQSSDSARGVVLGSNPSEGQVVPQGTRVDLVVSGGPSQLTMPDVVGQDIESASALLTQLGLAMAPVEYDSTSSQPRRMVIAQTPAAGAAVPAGTAVALRVAGAP